MRLPWSARRHQGGADMPPPAAQILQATLSRPVRQAPFTTSAARKTKDQEKPPKEPDLPTREKAEALFT